MEVFERRPRWRLAEMRVVNRPRVATRQTDCPLSLRALLAFLSDLSQAGFWENVGDAYLWFMVAGKHTHQTSKKSQPMAVADCWGAQSILY